jgi:hypothetical protein
MMQQFNHIIRIVGDPPAAATAVFRVDWCAAALQRQLLHSTSVRIPLRLVITGLLCNTRHIHHHLTAPAVLLRSY